VYFKPNMSLEANEWIRKVYGKTFRVANKTTYQSTVKVVTKEEEGYSTQVNHYIAERINHIKIEESGWNNDNRSYSEVVRGSMKDDSSQRCGNTNTESNKNYEKEDDDTVITDNKSIKSHDSNDTMTDTSDVTMQSKIILEMQIAIKQMQEDHKLLRDHIEDLESTVVTLAEDSEDTESYKIAEKKARKIKKKRKLNNEDTKDKHEKSSRKPTSVARKQKPGDNSDTTKLTVLKRQPSK